MSCLPLVNTGCELCLIVQWCSFLTADLTLYYWLYKKKKSSVAAAWDTWRVKCPWCTDLNLMHLVEVLAYYRTVCWVCKWTYTWFEYHAELKKLKGRVVAGRSLAACSLLFWIISFPTTEAFTHGYEWTARPKEAFTVPQITNSTR